MKRLVGVVAVAIVVGVLGGCRAERWSAVGPSGDPREEWVLQETDRFAKFLRVRTKGQLTDDAYFVPCDWVGKVCMAGGWYAGEVIWYYRPELLKHGLEWGSALARHEVCHGLSPGHGPEHEACMGRLREVFG